MPDQRFVLPTLVRDEVNQGLRFFDVWELVPEWAEDKIGQHIYYAFSDDVPVFPISEPGVPDKFTPEEVAKAWSAIMYVGVLGNRHELAQKRREWQLELNKREDVPDRYKKTEAEIMEQYEKDLWYVPPSIFDRPPAAEPDLSNQPKPGEVPSTPVDPEANPTPPVHIPSNAELEEAMRLQEEAKKKEEEGKQNPAEGTSESVNSGDQNPSDVQPEEDHSDIPEAEENNSPSESEESPSEGVTANAEDHSPSTPESEGPKEESQPEASDEDTPTPPRPKAALATWRKYAEKIGVEVDKSLSRDEIVEYIKSARPELFKESE